ncbi:MAG TPA: hypothetical protein VIG32_08090 [Candidatus Baltobacteraceae bacterium]
MRFRCIRFCIRRAAQPRVRQRRTELFERNRKRRSGAVPRASRSSFRGLAQPAKTGDKLAIVATYTARPVRGIYFIRPDKYYPHLQPEIWSQGEAEDNRRWFPTWDEPNQKTPVETIVTVQKGWTVTANGHLKSHTTTGATTTWDWDAAAVPALSTIETTDSEPGVRNAAWDAVADIKDNAKHAKHKMK